MIRQTTFPITRLAGLGLCCLLLWSARAGHALPFRHDAGTAISTSVHTDDVMPTFREGGHGHVVGRRSKEWFGSSNAGALNPLAASSLFRWTTGVQPVPPRPKTIQDPTRRWLILLGIGVAAVLIVVLIYGTGMKLGSARPRHVPGRLLVVENPVQDELRDDVIRLDAWAERPSDAPVSMGRDDSCDIVLAHESVGAHHCNVYLQRTREGITVQVEALQDRPIAVDGGSVEVSQRVPLTTGAQLRVGGFTLQYEETASPRMASG